MQHYNAEQIKRPSGRQQLSGGLPISRPTETRIYGIIIKDKRTDDWDDLRQSVVNMIINTIVIIVTGMVLMMTLLMLFLYRKTIKPATRIQRALLEYAADKNTPGIVKKMYEIKATPHNPITEVVYSQTKNTIPESIFAANLNQTESDFTNSLSAR